MSLNYEKHIYEKIFKNNCDLYFYFTFKDVRNCFTASNKQFVVLNNIVLLDLIFNMYQINMLQTVFSMCHF